MGATKIQFNPSTSKVSFTAATGKVQVITGDRICQARDDWLGSGFYEVFVAGDVRTKYNVGATVSISLVADTDCNGTFTVAFRQLFGGTHTGMVMNERAIGCTAVVSPFCPDADVGVMSKISS